MTALDRAEFARERNEYAEAVGRYGEALASVGPGDAGLRIVAHRGRAQCLYPQGRARDAMDDFAEARRLAQVLGNAELEIGILLDHATAADWMNDAPRSRRLADEAEQLARRSAVQGAAIRNRLAVARGRTAFREGRWEEARVLLEDAAAQAEQLGAAGVESLVIALLLLEVVLPDLGALDKAAQVADRVIALTRERGDRLNLASALNNRRNLLVARGDFDGALADQREFMRMGRELGLALSEYYGEYNTAELLYQAGDVAAAARHAERAEDLETASPDLAARPVAALLRARLLAHEGLVDEARSRLDGVDRAVACARILGQESGVLAPSEQVLAATVELATRDATEAEWDALVARSARASVEREAIEVLVLRARAKRRSTRATSPSPSRSTSTSASA